MSTVPKSIKCSLIIDEKPIITRVAHNDHSNPSSTLRAVRFACLEMLKNYEKSDNCDMVLQFKQIHNISMAIEQKIGEYLQGRFEPEIKNINLRFQDSNGLEQKNRLYVAKSF